MRVKLHVYEVSWKARDLFGTHDLQHPPRQQCLVVDAESPRQLRQDRILFRTGVPARLERIKR